MQAYLHFALKDNVANEVTRYRDIIHLSGEGSAVPIIFKIGVVQNTVCYVVVAKLVVYHPGHDLCYHFIS